MNTRLTVAGARAALADLVTPDDLNSTKFLQVLNEVVERYVTNGKWKGNLLEITFLSADGFVTLPFNFAAALAGTFARCPFPILTQYTSYILGGPGRIDEAVKWGNSLIDMGDGFVTERDIASGSAGVLRLHSIAGDDDVVVRVYGLDGDGEIIYDADGDEGEEVILAAPSVVTTNTFSRVTGFVKPHTKGFVRLGVVPPSNVEVTLSNYQPVETNPCYHRYQTGTVVEPTEPLNNGIRLLCNRRFIPLKAETDPVEPGNLAALRNGVQAWLSENATDYPSADAAWQRGIDFLNDEAKTFRGGGRPTINVENWGLGQSMYNVA